MGAKPSIDVAQRRARLARRHHLSPAARAATALDVARGMVALHATDPATVYLSIFARASVTPADVERALYDEKILMRMLGMRRTMFVVPIELAPVVQAGCTRAIAAQERRRTIQLFGQAGIADDIATWLGSIEEQTFEALRKRGNATAQQLSEDLPELKRQVRIASEKSYAGAMGVSSRTLFQLSADGRIVRGRPRGSWISGQYHWSPMDAWIPGGLAEMVVPAAQTVLIQGWLRSFGPGTLADLKWWTGLTLGEVMEIEPTYIEWIVRTIDRDPEISIAARVIMRHLTGGRVKRPRMDSVVPRGRNGTARPESPDELFDPSTGN